MGKKVGKLAVALAKPYFVVGDEVQGMLYIQAHESVPMHKVYVKVCPRCRAPRTPQPYV